MDFETTGYYSLAKSAAIRLTAKLKIYVTQDQPQVNNVRRDAGPAVVNLKQKHVGEGKSTNQKMLS
jgi:hypothetical protein